MIAATKSRHRNTDEAMAKKKAAPESRSSMGPDSNPKGEHGRTSPQGLRWGDIVVSDATDMHAACEVHLAKIGALLKAAANENRETIHMDGHTQLERCTRFLRSFAAHLQSAIEDHQLREKLEEKRSSRE